MSPTVSSEFERILACGRSARATIFGWRGSLTSTAVKFLGALSWAIHRMRLPSLASCIDMPSPMPPNPSSALCPSSLKFQISEPPFVLPLSAIHPLPIAVRWGNRSRAGAGKSTARTGRAQLPLSALQWGEGGAHRASDGRVRWALPASALESPTSPPALSALKGGEGARVGISELDLSRHVLLYRRF